MFRYALVRQHDQSDCGAAALATVALQHRVRAPLEELRDLAGTDQRGTNLLGLVRAAERIGLAARAVRGSYEALRDVPLPAIAHLRTAEGQGHFAVVHRAGRRRVILADPATGLLRERREDFCARWTGYLLVLTPEGPTRRSPAGRSSPRKRFLDLVRPHAGLLLEAFACTVLFTLLGLSTSFFLRHLVDSVLVHSDGRLLDALALGMLAIALFRTLFAALRRYLLMHVGRKVDLILVSRYMRHLLALPISFFASRKSGEVLGRISDASKIRDAVSGAALSGVVDGTLVLLAGGFLFIYDVTLALLALSFLPLLLGAVAAHHPWIRNRAREAMEKAGTLQSHLLEDMAGVESIKAFGIESRRMETGDQRLVEVVQAGFSTQLAGLGLESATTLLKAVAGIVVLWYGGSRVMSGALSLGELMFFFTLLGLLLDPLERLASVSLSLQQAAVAIDRLFQVLELAPEQAEGTKKTAVRGPIGDIRLEGVSFRYGCRSRVLEDVDLEVRAGSTVAIVGESGSGKSTLLKLLPRFHEPEAGRLTVDGIDARDLDLHSLRERIGFVSQDPFLFHGTIAENIAVGNPGADRHQVMAAARAAGLEEFLASLPDRYETMIGDRGANLSGGQRQRIAIARALLKDPDLFLFDEATSHLDTITEQAIQGSLRSRLAGKTVIVVAHRLSTVKDADCIYLLEDGRVAEEGTHQSLLALRGRYAALWQAQTGLSQEGRAAASPGPRSAGILTLRRAAGNGALKS